MNETNMSKDLLSLLESLPNLAQIPRSELEWIIQHGKYEIYQPGLIFPDRHDSIRTLVVPPPPAR